MLEKIKDRLSEAIRHCGMPYKEIAQKLGVTDSLISQYCSKSKLPKLDTFARLCIILDETPNYILGYED